MHSTGNFGDDRNNVRIPSANHIVLHNIMTVFDHHHRTVGDGISLKGNSLGANHRNFTVTGKDDDFLGVGPGILLQNRTDVAESDLTWLANLDVTVTHFALHYTTDVEGAHGELSSGFTNRLGGNDTYRHAFLNQGTCGKIMAVAHAANAKGSGTGGGAAHHHLVQADLAQLVDFLALFRGKDLILLHQNLLSFGMDNGGTANTTAKNF